MKPITTHEMADEIARTIVAKTTNPCCHISLRPSMISAGDMPPMNAMRLDPSSDNDTNTYYATSLAARCAQSVESVAFGELLTMVRFGLADTVRIVSALTRLAEDNQN